MQYVLCSLTLFPLKISVPSSTVKFRVQSTNSCGDTGWGSESAQSITLTQFSVIYKSKSQAYIAFLTSTRSEIMQYSWNNDERSYLMLWRDTTLCWKLLRVLHSCRKFPDPQQDLHFLRKQWHDIDNDNEIMIIYLWNYLIYLCLTSLCYWVWHHHFFSC